MPIPFKITERMMGAARLKNHSALAADLGVTPQALSNYKKRGDFPAHLVIDFAAKHSLSVDSLITGKVPGVQVYFPHIINVTLSADEADYIDKALKVLRAPDVTLGQVFRHSLDALVDGQVKETIHA